MTLIALLPLFLALISASPVVAQSGTDNFTVPSQDNTTQNVWDIPTVSPVNESSNRGSVRVVLISIFTILFVLCSLIICIAVRCYRRRSKSSWEAREESHRVDAKEDSDVELDECFSHRPRKFTYAELCAATRNFSEDGKLGEGGFGGVYWGVLPATEEEVAVKRISQGSKQGKREYVSEVTTISKLSHHNLVRLLGWCHQKGEFFLVYEFLPNGSLDKHLFGNTKNVLNWKRRYSVACDIAAALVYLHEDCQQRVLHRDIKSSNVMLDSHFNAKLGDFGLARLVERDQAPSHTTAPAGTFGYLAPECVNIGKASVESDVFSFGAVILEIACGRPILNRSTGERLVEWVWDLYGRGRLFDSADQKLNGNFKAEELERLLLLGLLCSHPDPRARPKMREAQKILKFEVQLPNVPSKMPVAGYDYPSSVPTGYDSCMTSTSSNNAGTSVSSMHASISSSSTGSRNEFISKPPFYHSEDHAGVVKRSRTEFKSV